MAGLLIPNQVVQQTYQKEKRITKKAHPFLG